jgi:hypothetical protein
MRSWTSRSAGIGQAANVVRIETDRIVSRLFLSTPNGSRATITNILDARQGSYTYTFRDDDSTWFLEAIKSGKPSPTVDDFVANARKVAASPVSDELRAAIEVRLDHRTQYRGEIPANVPEWRWAQTWSSVGAALARSQPGLGAPPPAVMDVCRFIAAAMTISSKDIDSSFAVDAIAMASLILRAYDTPPKRSTNSYTEGEWSSDKLEASGKGFLAIEDRLVGFLGNFRSLPEPTDPTGDIRLR